MATKLQGLRKAFLELLAEALAPLGFKRRGDSFYRKQPHGQDMIDMTFVSHPGWSFEAEVYVGVRHNAVENLVIPYCPDVPSQIAKWADTVGNRLDNMNRSTDWIWDISEATDPRNEVRNLMETAVQGIALPYFRRFADLEEVLKVLSEDHSTWGSEAHRMAMGVGLPSAGMSAIAAAYLLGKRSAFDELLARFTSIYKNKAESGNFVYQQGLPSFMALAEDLKKRWAETETEARHATRE